jgi:sialate O-acetylesterase
MKRANLLIGLFAVFSVAAISETDDTFVKASARLYTPAEANAPIKFALSSSLGSNMVLQRAPQAALVWGFAATGSSIKTTFLGQSYTSTADATGIWRQALPPQAATATPSTISFTSSTGEPAITITNVLFGDVYICSGQS